MALTAELKMDTHSAESELVVVVLAEKNMWDRAMVVTLVTLELEL